MANPICPNNAAAILALLEADRREEELERKRPIPQDRIECRANGIMVRLKEAKLELEPREVCWRVSCHAAHLLLATSNKRRKPGKAFFLRGPVGCGKTTLVKFAFASLPVKFISANQIIQDYEDYEDSFRADRRNYERRDIILDDLGSERGAVQRYGNVFDVGVWLEWRYECFKRFNALTYITTNIGDSKELEKRYGNRVLSRIREMTEPIAYYFRDRRA